ncbi:MAG: DVU0298 family protein [Thermodesulfobacteriota bacterium]
MTRVRAIKLRKDLEQVLKSSDRKTAYAFTEPYSLEQLTGPIFAQFYHPNELVKFRSIVLLGMVAGRTAPVSMEKVRILMRKLMWYLNDESGGIGWGAPEAMGEVMMKCERIGLEFGSILVSYLDTDGNYIEHDALQRGVLWGIGTLVETVVPHDPERLLQLVTPFLGSTDAVKRGFAARAVLNMGIEPDSISLERMESDGTVIDIFNGWHFRRTSIAGMVTEQKEKDNEY